jgi:serine/threonine-protein phosphatase 2A regulatory subunit B
MASGEIMDWPFEATLEQTDIFDTADIISTVEFDHTGNYLATGDKGGRVVLFERNETVRCQNIPIPTNGQANI